MIQKLIGIGAVAAVLVLAACGPVTFEEYPTPGEENAWDEVENTETPAGTRQADQGQGGLPLSTEMELLIGTYRLRGGHLEVTKDQAEQLIPLWATLQLLTNSMTATDEQIEENTARIQAAMTPAQLEAIDAMNLGVQDMVALMTELGISGGRGWHIGTHTPDPNHTPEVEPTGAAGEVTPTEEIATPDETQIAEYNEHFSRWMPAELLEALIAYLQGIQ